MVYTDSQHIVAFLQVRGHVVKKRYIAVGAPAKQMPVQVNLAPVIYPFEIDIMTRCVVFNPEVFAIPAYPTRQVPGATGQCGRQLPLYGPIVWQRKLPPFAVVIVSPDNSRVVRQPEQPSVIELCGIAKCHLRLYRSNGQHCQQEDKSSPVIFKIHFHIDFL